MQFPMTGSWSIRIVAVRPFTIHSDVYYEIQAVRLDDGSEADMTLRVPQHATKSVPAIGAIMSATFLMGQVTGMEIQG